MNFIYRVCSIRSVVNNKNSEKMDFIIGLLLANKVLDDHTFTNRTWSDLSRIDIKDINQAEVEYLSLLDHKMVLQREDYVNWVDDLQNSWKMMQEGRMPSLFDAPHQWLRGSKTSPHTLPIGEANQIPPRWVSQPIPYYSVPAEQLRHQESYAEYMATQFSPAGSFPLSSMTQQPPTSSNRRHSFDAAVLEQLSGIGEFKGHTYDESYMAFQWGTPMTHYSDPDVEYLQHPDPSPLHAPSHAPFHTQSVFASNIPSSTPLQLNSGPAQTFSYHHGSGGMASSMAFANGGVHSQQHGHYTYRPHESSGQYRLPSISSFQSSKPPVYPTQMMPRSSSDILSGNTHRYILGTSLYSVPPTSVAFNGFAHQPAHLGGPLP
ncbi:hypothetical protein HDU67_002288 [Dinochytrium kinnereticum]|nr:hypothetical protein HDU67_002288 [Dinochytrium kinnereticum]